MSEAPFSMSMPLIGISFVSIFTGALIGGLLSSMGYNGVLFGALCGFLPQPVNSVLRVIFGSAMAHAAGVKGKAPYAFSAPIRYTIAAIASVGASAGVLKVWDMPVNFISGAFIALVTTFIVAMIMTIKVSMSK